VFWVISVYFNLRNTLPKSGTFLPGHPVYMSYIYYCNGFLIQVSWPREPFYLTPFTQHVIRRVTDFKTVLLSKNRPSQHTPKHPCLWRYGERSCNLYRRWSMWFPCVSKQLPALCLTPFKIPVSLKPTSKRSVLVT
jgi:hypothetical protein